MMNYYEYKQAASKKVELDLIKKVETISTRLNIDEQSAFELCTDSNFKCTVMISNFKNEPELEIIHIRETDSLFKIYSNTDLKTNETDIFNTSVLMAQCGYIDLSKISHVTSSFDITDNKLKSIFKNKTTSTVKPVVNSNKIISPFGNALVDSEETIDKIINSKLLTMETTIEVTNKDNKKETFTNTKDISSPAYRVAFELLKRKLMA